MVEEDELVEKDELIQVKYPERVCYVCGRTEKDIEMLFNEPIKAFDSRIKTLENEIKKFRDEYKMDLSELIKDTEKSQYLDLKVETIKTDLPKFREAIPRLDDLLEFGDDTKSLSEIRDKIKKAVENSSDYNNYEIDVMKKEIDKLRLRNKQHGLYEYTINSENFYCPKNSNSFFGRNDKITGKITVYVCAVCADMFSRVGWAVYEDVNTFMRSGTFSNKHIRDTLL